MRWDLQNNVHDLASSRLIFETHEHRQLISDSETESSFLENERPPDTVAVCIVCSSQD